MNWAWAPSLEQIWHSSSFPMWLTLVAAGFFGIIVLITLVRAEKSVFGSAESTAAAVSYAASQISRLTALGDVATADTSMTPELPALRRAVEHDRYGLMAYALAAR